MEQHDPQYEETNDPRNPPKAVVNRDVRRATLWTFLAPLVVLFVVIGIALLYWMRQPPSSGEVDSNTLNPATGTTGDQDPATPSGNDQNKTETDNLRVPGGVVHREGGFEPTPRPNNTKEELEFRAGDEAR